MDLETHLPRSYWNCADKFFVLSTSNEVASEAGTQTTAAKEEASAGLSSQLIDVAYYYIQCDLQSYNCLKVSSILNLYFRSNVECLELVS